jgi:hypothetical protein
VAVPEDHWAPGADEVDVLVRVDVEEVGSSGVIYHHRFAPDGSESPRWTVHPTRHQALGATKY